MHSQYGGYNLQAISRSALAVAQTLMGEPPRPMSLPPINATVVQVLRQVQSYQAPYWECMRPGVVDVQDLVQKNTSRLHDVLRGAQRQQLSENYGMVPLYVQRDILYKSYENQVLHTWRFLTGKKLMVIIHDP